MAYARYGAFLAIAGVVVVGAAAGYTHFVAASIGGALVALFGFAGRSVAMGRRDPLTGALGRSEIYRRMDQAIVRYCAKGGGAIAVLSLDLEKFGSVNSRYGQAAGDEVLMETFRRIVDACSPSSLVARMGGDEFLVVLMGASENDVSGWGALVSERLLDRLQAPISVGGAEIRPKVRLGGSVRAFHGVRSAVSAESIIMHANIARGRLVASRAKREIGRLPFDKKLEVATSRAALIEREFARAMDEGELFLAYQPIVDFRSGNVVKCEALLRWESPKMGAVTPDEFIPIVERSGQMDALGWFVINESCDQIARWSDAGAKMKVCINVSASQMGCSTFSCEVLRALACRGIAPNLLGIEITESVAIDNDLSVQANLSTLTAAGVSVFLDDFGTGFSSLCYLSKLNVQGIKIDKSFVVALREGSQGARDRLLVEAICILANSMGLVIVAEGVDSPWRAAELDCLGVRLMQGFLYSPAVSPEGLDALVLEGASIFLERAAVCVGGDAVEGGHRLNLVT